PGAQVADRPAVVADASVLFASILEYNPEVGPVDDDELPAGMPFSSTAVFETWLWSSGPASEVLDELAGVGVEPLEVRPRDGYAAEQTLVSARWVLDLVTALGAGAAALGGAVLLLFAVRRADRDRVAELLLTRMGTSRGELRLTRALEMGLVTLRAVSAA